MQSENKENFSDLSTGKIVGITIGLVLVLFIAVIVIILLNKFQDIFGIIPRSMRR